MIIFGLVLIAIGVAALIDVSIWPIILIALGASTLLSYALRGYPETARLFNCWQCWPIRYDREQKETKASRSE
ncbi:MAG: hypothetical protein BZY87_09930 [SAR202 cluster bacterium Io17-Chloro-G6]|nr:MAG: hypothetical protein BZY87_09930 [SAR202 cluster bacterium Io17-Chloro-G6]